MVATPAAPGGRAAVYHFVGGEEDAAGEPALDRLRRWCCDNGWHLAGEYVDYGRGGAAGRFEYERLMADASRRRFSLVVFHSLDLLCRGGCRDAVTDLERLFRLGVGVKSLEEPELDTTAEHGAAVAALIALLARHESRHLSRRVKKGMKRARREGKAMGRPPLPIEVQMEIARRRRSGASIATIAGDLGVSRSTALKYSQPTLDLLLRRR